MIQDLARKKLLSKVDVENPQGIRPKVTQEIQNRFARDRRALGQRAEANCVRPTRQIRPAIASLKKIPSYAFCNLVHRLATGIERNDDSARGMESVFLKLRNIQMKRFECLNRFGPERIASDSTRNLCVVPEKTRHVGKIRRGAS